MAPAGMLAVSAPSAGTLMVKRTVVLPGNALAAVTARSGNASQLQVADLDRRGIDWLIEGYVVVNGPGNVNTPPTGGAVATTCSSRTSYRNVPVNAATGSPAAALKAPAGTLMVWSP